MSKWLVVLLALPLLIVGSIAYAAIPGSDGTISGCYDERGNLAVIDVESSETCKTGETSLDWNQGKPSLWAVVDTDGDLLFGSHVVSSQENPPAGSGNYVVTFDQTVEECAHVATIAEGPAIGVRTNPNGTSAVSVNPVLASGGGQRARFSLAVFC